MKVKDLRKIIDMCDDDFELEIKLEERIPEDELKNSIYPYPFNYKCLEIGKDSYDIGHSEKRICIFCVESKNQ